MGTYDFLARAPERFRIIPDDYHVPYAGTAGDGRRFFLSEELFTDGRAFVGLFLWHADGTHDEVVVDEVARRGDVPPGQAAPAGAAELVAERLRGLGDYTLEAIDVAPFVTVIEGVRFGWEVDEYDGTLSIMVSPGDFVCYYEPWDGLDYDT